jgi:hypothetical protein
VFYPSITTFKAPTIKQLQLMGVGWQEREYLVGKVAVLINLAFINFSI